LVTRVDEEVKQSSKDYVVVENQVFKINPQTYNFILAVSSFYELICFSNMSDSVLSHIIDHIEKILNLTVSFIIKMNSSQRVVVAEEPRVFFNYIIDKSWYN
jgi:hypothetical protein